MKFIRTLKINRFVVWLMIFSMSFQLIGQPLYGFLFSGRYKKATKDNSHWVYGENKSTRKIAFVEFENYSQGRSEDFSDLSQSIPRSIAKKLDKVKEIETLPEDFIPVFKSRQSAYRVVDIPFKEAEKDKKSREKMGEIFRYGKILSLDYFYPQSNSFFSSLQTELSNISNPFDQSANATTNTNTTATKLLSANDLINQSIEANKPIEKKEPSDLNNTNTTDFKTNSTTNNKTDKKSEKKSKLDIFTSFTNHRVAYMITNEEKKSYSFYLFKSSENNYYDAQLMPKVSLEAINLPVKEDENGHRYFYDEGVAKKKFSVAKDLYKLGNSSLADLVKQSDADYFLFGSFKVVKNMTVVKMYMINAYKKTISHFFTKEIPNYKIKDEVEFMDVDVLAYLQGRKVLENIEFKSGFDKDHEAIPSIYLNGDYYGKLPKKIPKMISGSYSFSAPVDGYQLKSVKSAKTGFTKKSKVLDIKESGEVFTFFYSKRDDSGSLDLKINNGVSGDVYINNELKAVNTSSYHQDLPEGRYYVAVTKPNYQSRSFLVDVETKKSSSIKLGLNELAPDPWWEDVFFNYARNVKVFAVLGFLFLGGTVGTYVETVDFEDKRSKAREQIRLIEADNKDPGYLREYEKRVNEDYNKYLAVSLGLLGGSLLSFGIMTWFHVLDIRSDRASIETSVDNDGDVEIVIEKKI